MDMSKAALIDPLEDSGLSWFGQQRWSERVRKQADEKNKLGKYKN